MSFNLNDVVKKGQEKLPPRILFIGVEGVGKTTIANRFPDPLFICGETGLTGSEFSQTANAIPENWQQAKEIVGALITEEKPSYKTLVLDTIDWLEPIMNDFVSKRDGKANIEAYGYGKGYDVAVTEMRHLLAGMEKLRKRGYTIVLLSHCHIKTFNNPSGDDYDRFEMKVSKKLAALLKEWCDAVLFARFEVYTYKEGSKAKAKAIGTTERVLYTSNSPSWDGKNRYGLPEKLPLDYDALMEAMNGDGKGVTSELESSIETLIAESDSMSDATKEQARMALKRDAGNTVKLKTLLNRVKASA